MRHLVRHPATPRLSAFFRNFVLSWFLPRFGQEKMITNAGATKSVVLDFLIGTLGGPRAPCPAGVLRASE
jgi:hypothetical protein